MRKFLTAALLLIMTCAGARGESNVVRSEDVIYGRKFGAALTMDVFKPPTPNGVGIVFAVSGGWFSAKEHVNQAVYDAFLRRGYTVFAVVHGSQPKFQIPEIVDDMNRAVRFVRHNAKSYGIDPGRIGISGASAGGHLSLMLATKGGNGKPDAKDPVDRESSAIQAVACFFPPTDFLNYGGPGTNAVGIGVLKAFKAAFGPESDTEEGRMTLGRNISPIYFVHTNQPPVLIIHGDADLLVPIQQAESFAQRSHEMGAVAKVVVKKGQAHGWKDWIADLTMFADWFDEHLRGIKPHADSLSTQ